jgi:hypothetical protein
VLLAGLRCELLASARSRAFRVKSHSMSGIATIKTITKRRIIFFFVPIWGSLGQFVLSLRRPELFHLQGAAAQLHSQSTPEALFSGSRALRTLHQGDNEGVNRYGCYRIFGYPRRGKGTVCSFMRAGSHRGNRTFL